jgi:gamma-glutamylaminecyclotransferase
LKRASVFAYGTLKEGYPNFRVNTGIRVPGEFVTVQRFPLYLVGPRRVPWMVNSPGEGAHVAGQLFEVDEAGLRQMDVLEGIDAVDGYRRTTIEIVERDKAGVIPLTALVYVKLPEQLAVETIRIGPLREYLRDHAALYSLRED